ncbi:MAG TPA: cell division ATP-binding protein FtsE [Firmicutes bacterium]|nr:cell division ATP-binding protein FtsE [Bacillota bacterium]
MLELYAVSKIYGNGVVALRDVDLKVNKGEFVFIVGPSGAGKTTLTRLILAEEKPTKGQIIVNNKVVNDLKRSEIPYLRRQIGTVFQDFRLMNNWTVEENVSFAMKVIEASRRSIRKRVPEVLEMVGLANKAKHLPTQLSGGEQQRVALARAIVNQPYILLADEPTGNLDPETAWGIMKVLQDINAQGTTILMVTHAKNIVDEMRKRVIALEGGRIVRDETRGAYGNEN